MGHKVLTHCFRSLIWLALLHFQTKASPCPGTEPETCKVQQSNLGVSAWNTALPATNGDAAAAPETPPLLDQGERGSSVVTEMTCSPPENDQTCGEEESVHGFELLSTPCENVLVIQAEGGNSNGAFQSGGSSRIALEKVPSYGSNGNPNSAMAEDQVQALNHQLPLEHGSEAEQQDVCLPVLEQAMMDESALNSDSSLLLLPTELDQSMQGHECRPSTTTGGDSINFPGAELRKGTNRPESGQPSRQHNDIPLTEILRSTAEGTMSDADASLKERGLGIDNKDISAGGEFQAPAATSGGSVLDLAERNGDGGGAFENIDSDNLLSILVKNSGRPGSGAPSKGHN